MPEYLLPLALLLLLLLLLPLLNDSEAAVAGAAAAWPESELKFEGEVGDEDSPWSFPAAKGKGTFSIVEPLGVEGVVEEEEEGEVADEGKWNKVVEVGEGEEVEEEVVVWPFNTVVPSVDPFPPCTTETEGLETEAVETGPVETAPVETMPGEESQQSFISDSSLRLSSTGNEAEVTGEVERADEVVIKVVVKVGLEAAIFE